jgi:N utilization substance protein A
VDIRSETEFAAEEAEHGYEEEEVQGRCSAVLSNGRRCPNAALPGSRYCGIESHQALAAIDSDNVADLGSEGGSGVASEVPEVAEVAVEDSEAPEVAVEDSEVIPPEILSEQAPPAAEEQAT